MLKSASADRHSSVYICIHTVHAMTINQHQFYQHQFVLLNLLSKEINNECKYAMNLNDHLYLKSTSMERYARNIRFICRHIQCNKKPCSAPFVDSPSPRKYKSYYAQTLTTANMSNSSYDLYFI